MRYYSISSVLSKVREHCILDRYSSLFVTSDNPLKLGIESSMVVLLHIFSSFAEQLYICVCLILLRLLTAERNDATSKFDLWQSAA